MASRSFSNRTFTVLQPFFMRTLLQPFFNSTTLNGTVNGKIFFSSTVLYSRSSIAHVHVHVQYTLYM